MLSLKIWQKWALIAVSCILNNPYQRIKRINAINLSSFVFFKKDVLKQFRFTTKFRGRYRDFPYIPAPTDFLIINITYQNGTFFFFLSRMYLLRHIRITQSPYLTLGFTLGIIYSMNLD